MKCQGNARVQRAQLNRLRRDFEILAMKQGESVDVYFTRVMVIANEMRNCGEDMSDVKIVEKILRILTDKWNYIVCSIEESKDVDSLSVDALQSSLLVHEHKFKKDGGEEQALAVTDDYHGGRGRGRSGFAFRGGRGRGRGRRIFNKATVECYNCHKLGHFQSECQANYAEEEVEEMLLMAYVEEIQEEEEVESSQLSLMAHIEEPQKKHHNDVWFLDSGCSNHMCGELSLFSELNEGIKKTVRLGNHSQMKVMGAGNIRLSIEGVSHLVQDVLYVPDLKNNLLSIGQLQEKGLEILIKFNECRIYHPSRGLIIQSNMSTNRMFALFSKNETNMAMMCLQTDSQDKFMLWHQRYGHLVYSGLKTLKNKEMVNGLPDFAETEVVCTDCLKGKQHREIMPKKAIWRASEKLELIYSDICGPISPTSNGGKRYLICFIDDFSRKAWVYFLVYKAYAFATFKQFKSGIEKQSGLRIKCLRTDRGGEFTSSEFNEFCKDSGIKRQLTTPYTPQHNGVAERKNRTVMNMVRSMLVEKNVPKVLWPEAVNWAFYLLNRCPTSSVKDVTPEEAWSGIKPSVAHLRVFGCIVHTHIPDVHRTKLKDKSRRGVLFGLSVESKGYKLFDPTSKRMTLSRDVIFEEDKKWDWDATYEESIQVDLEWENEEAQDDAGRENAEEVAGQEPEAEDGDNEIVENPNTGSSPMATATTRTDVAEAQEGRGGDRQDHQ